MSDKKEEKRSVQISPGRMRLSQYERQEWVANAPEGCTPDDIKKQDFWSLMAYQMKPYDRVEVRADDGSWLAELVVVGCGRNWAKVSVLNHYKLADAGKEMKGDAEFRIDFKGPQRKWCVIRNSDDEYIRDKLGSKEEAMAAMKEQETASAA